MTGNFALIVAGFVLFAAIVIGEPLAVPRLMALAVAVVAIFAGIRGLANGRIQP